MNGLVTVYYDPATIKCPCCGKPMIARENRPTDEEVFCVGCDQGWTGWAALHPAPELAAICNCKTVKSNG